MKSTEGFHSGGAGWKGGDVPGISRISMQIFCRYGSLGGRRGLITFIGFSKGSVSSNRYISVGLLPSPLQANCFCTVPGLSGGDTHDAEILGGRGASLRAHAPAWVEEACSATRSKGPWLRSQQTRAESWLCRPLGRAPSASQAGLSQR